MKIFREFVEYRMNNNKSVSKVVILSKKKKFFYRLIKERDFDLEGVVRIILSRGTGGFM